MMTTRFRLKLDELAGLCDRMQITAKAGVDWRKFFQSEAKYGGTRFKQVMQALVADLEAGYSLASGLARRGKAFPPSFVQLVHAGETGGGLVECFEYLASHYRVMLSSRRQSVAQLSKPALQIIAVATLISVLIFVAASSGGSAWDGVLAVSLFWLRNLLSFALVAVLILAVSRNWFQCQKYITPLLLRLPAIGEVIGNTILSRFCLALGILLNAGVDAKRAIKQAYYCTGSFYHVSGLPAALIEIEKGSAFSVAIEQSQVFDRQFIREVEVAELSGTDSESLLRLAGLYQQFAHDGLERIVKWFATGFQFLILFLMAAQALVMLF